MDPPSARHQTAPPPPKASRRTLLAVTIASLASAAAVHAYVWYGYLPAFNTSHTALEGVTPERSQRPPTPALTGHLVVMVLDGLGWEEARALPAFADLSRLGHGRMLLVEFPSYTYPAITSLVTGVEPSDSGVRLNGDWEGATGLEAIPSLAARAGAQVSLRTRGWKPFEELMRPAPGARIARGRMERVSALAAERTRNDIAPPARWTRRAEGPPADLTLEYLDEIDTTAHEVGTRSARYRAAVEHVGSLVAERLSRLDLDRETLVVVSDHAHRPEGGHGGTEPEVLRACWFAAGPTLRAGVELPPRPMRDVASTLAVLAGITAPATNTGRPMLDGLTVDPTEQAALLEGPIAQQVSWLCRLHQAPGCDDLGTTLAKLSAREATAVAAAEALSDAVFAARATARRQTTESARPKRAAVALGSCALAIALAVATSRRQRSGSAPRAASRVWWVAAPALFVTIYLALLLLRGHRPTFSALPPMRFFLQDTFISGCVAALTTALAAARGGGPHSGACLLAAVGVPFVVLAAWVGCDPSVVVPPVGGVLVFYAAPAVLFAAVAALLIALLTWRRGD